MEILKVVTRGLTNMAQSIKKYPSQDSNKTIERIAFLVD